MNAASSQHTHYAVKPLSESDVDGRDRTREPFENAMWSCAGSYDIVPLLILFTASANITHFFNISDADLELTLTQSESPFLLDNAFAHIMNAIVNDLPICLDDTHIFLLLGFVMNVLWYGYVNERRFICRISP